MTRLIALTVTPVY